MLQLLMQHARRLTARKLSTAAETLVTGKELGATHRNYDRSHRQCDLE